MASIIAVIKGITPSDFWIHPDKESSIIPIIIQSYKKPSIPRKFCGVSSWLTSSELKCWFCGRIPTSYPRFVPQNIHDAGEFLCCDVMGNFDTWNCAISWVRQSFLQEYVDDILKHIYMIEELFSGSRKKYIPPAPSPTKMEAYCGEEGITEEKYGQHIAKLNKQHGC